MIDLSRVRQVMLETVFTERNELRGITLAEVMSFHESVLSFLTARQLIKHQDILAEVYKINWKRDFSGLYKIPVSSCFELIKADGINNYLFLSVYRTAPDKDLMQEVQDLKAYCASDSQVVLCTITEGPLLKFKRWRETQEKSIGLKPIGEHIEINTADTRNNVRVQLWEVLTRTALDREGDVTQAMRDAVENMYFENLLRMVRKIIYLRYNVNEDELKPELRLEEIIRMAFAKEQGVTKDEVYDPEVMTGMSDSQLAVTNFINDMQKAFSVSLSNDEITEVATLDDLVRLMASKI